MFPTFFLPLISSMIHIVTYDFFIANSQRWIFMNILGAYVLASSFQRTTSHPQK